MSARATFAERLGWPAGSRVVLFHTDDAALCRSSNRGAIEALEKGLARSLSVMTPCSGFPEMAAYLRAHPETDAGVHLTLTSEFGHFRWKPISPPDEVPGLVDATGHFHAEARSVMARATADEVDREIRAQLRLARERGIDVTHLDSHMGVLFTRPDFFERYARLGIEMGIPILAEAPFRTLRERMGNLARKAAGRLRLRPCFDFPRQNAAAVARIWNAHLPVIDRIYADVYGWPPATKHDRMCNLVRGLAPGITVILLHCTRPDGDIELLEDTAPTRQADAETACSAQLTHVLADAGVTLTTWRELMSRRASL